MKIKEERPDIHGYEERVRRYLALIAESSIPEEDKKALVEFSEGLRAQGLHVGRVMKYLYHLRVCAENVTKLSDSPSLRTADARAITKLVAWLNGSPRFKPETRKDFNVVLKRFFQWLRAPPEEYPRWRRKHVYPYLFRHSAATRDARLGFTESQLCLKYGWVMGSRMPRIYLHLAGTDLRQKIMEVYGGGEVERPKPQTLRCPRCSAPNHPGQNYCFTCGSPLEPAPKTVELEEMKKDLSEIRETLRTLLSRRP